MNESTVRPTITLVIELIPGQPVRVTGPLADKNLCFRMLFEAGLAIKDYSEDGEKKVIIPQMIPPGMMGKGGRG